VWFVRTIPLLPKKKDRMPRLVPNDATGPIKIDPQEKAVFICACGLSQNTPYCDGSHNQAAKQETDGGKVYEYGADRKTVVKEHDA